MHKNNLTLAITVVASGIALFFAAQFAIDSTHPPRRTVLKIAHHPSIESEAVFTQFLGKTGTELQQYLVARGLQSKVEVFGCPPKSYPQGFGPDAPMTSPLDEGLIARVRLCEDRVEMVVERFEGGAVTYAIS